MSHKPMDDTRRKLIRGVAAAPAVFTLPASATSAMGSISACATRATSREGMPAYLTQSPDKWVRVQLEVHQVKLDGPASGSWMDAVKIADNWYDVRTGGKIGLIKDSRPTNPKRHAYGLVDYRGGKGGDYAYYPQSSVQNPVPGASCWNSLNATAMVGSDNVLR